MQKRLYVQWVVGIVLICLGAMSFANCTRPLRVAWENEAPYNYEQTVAGRKQLTGLDVDILRAVLQKMHCEVVFMDMPWSRQLAELREGEIDIMLGVSKSPERQQFGYFSKPYRRENVRLYMKKGSARQYPLTDLSAIAQFPLHIGVVRGNYYGERFRTLMTDPRFNASIESVSTDVENFRKLTVGHVQGILVDAESAMQILRSDPDLSMQVEMHPFAVFSDEVHAMFSKRSITPALVSQFDLALDELKKGNEYNVIWQRYVK